jgi:MoaA/NifB/PqqE/SkfB family radical SAM enzyme
MGKQLRYEFPHSHNGRVHINSFFPPYPSRAFDRFLETVFNGRRVPYSTYFAVTDQCPYRCPHCSYGKHQRGALDTTQALEIIRQIRSIGTVTIGFTGGEPLVRKDIVQLVKSAGEDTATVMFSTGYNLTDDLAERLRDAGLDCMTIGIESDDAERHDAVRGVKGSFDTALSSIRISRQAGLYTAISTIGSRDKLENGTLERLAQLVTCYDVHEFRILEPVPTGSYSGQSNEVLSAGESQQIAQFHKQWNRKGRGPSITSFARLESDEMFGCGAGFHHLFIDALGNVCPCDLTPLALGNVLQEPLSEIWGRMSQWFDRPRCGCFVKQLSARSDVIRNADAFPICRETSEELCTRLNNNTELPMVFKNLFRGRRPANPAKNQR